jgi:hypothetical protein
MEEFVSKVLEIVFFAIVNQVFTYSSKINKKGFFLGWEGILCDSETDECMSAPCQNGAVCVDLMADYSCACLFGVFSTYRKL